MNYYSIFHEKKPQNFILSKYSSSEAIIDHLNEVIFDVILYGSSTPAYHLAFILAKNNLLVLNIFSKGFNYVPIISQTTEFISGFIRKCLFKRTEENFQSFCFDSSQHNEFVCYLEYPRLNEDMALTAMDEGMLILGDTEISNFTENNGRIEITLTRGQKILKASCKILVLNWPIGEMFRSEFSYMSISQASLNSKDLCVWGKDFLILTRGIQCEVYLPDFKGSYLKFDSKKDCLKGRVVFLNQSNPVETAKRICQALNQTPCEFSYDLPKILAGSYFKWIKKTVNMRKLIRILEECGLNF